LKTKVLVSIEVVPGQQAKQERLGAGRQQPNHSPYCPPPTGRMQFSLNPCFMLQQIAGKTQHL
jgi:hypothetical protein